MLTLGPRAVLRRYSTNHQPPTPNTAMTWIGLAGGGRVDLLEPRPEQFAIEDIAIGLSRTPRFNGHTERFYSVAQHSLLASELVYPEHALAALLHDASEAYMADVNRPLKDLLLNYREIESRLMTAIAERFGFAWPLPPAVKQIDDRLLVTEKRLLQPHGPAWDNFQGVPPLDELKIYYQSPEAAEVAFLRRYEELTAG